MNIFFVVFIVVSIFIAVHFSDKSRLDPDGLDQKQIALTALSEDLTCEESATLSSATSISVTKKQG